VRMRVRASRMFVSLFAVLVSRSRVVLINQLINIPTLSGISERRFLEE